MTAYTHKKIFFCLTYAYVESEAQKRRAKRKVTYDRNTNVNWRDARENGFRGRGKECMLETAGEVVAEMEKRVIEERRGEQA